MACDSACGISAQRPRASGLQARSEVGSMRSIGRWISGFVRTGRFPHQSGPSSLSANLRRDRGQAGGNATRRGGAPVRQYVDGLPDASRLSAALRVSYGRPGLTKPAGRALRPSGKGCNQPIHACGHRTVPARVTTARTTSRRCSGRGFGPRPVRRCRRPGHTSPSDMPQ
jgi:hypothetical protein